MANNPQFNFRLPLEVLEEFQAKVDELRGYSAKIPEYGDAAQAAMIMWARADLGVQLEWLKRLRSYDLDAALLKGAGTAEDAVGDDREIAGEGSHGKKKRTRRRRTQAGR